MAPITVMVYSEQPMTADAQKVIKAVLDEYPPNTFHFIEIGLSSLSNNNSGAGVLVFGTCPLPLPLAVRTISLSQVSTKANAVSVLKAAFDQFYVPQKKHPSKPFPRWDWRGLDPEAPTAIDIETSGNLDTTLPEDVDIINIAFYQENKWSYMNKEQFLHNSGMGIQDWYDAVREAVKFFQTPIWHNGKFDIRVIEAKTGYRPPMFFDTMLAHHVLHQAARDHKLKHLARQYLGAPEWETDLSKYTVGGAHYENIPRDLLIDYNLWDVYWTYELWKFLQPQILSDPHASTAFMLEMEASNFLLEVEQKGFAVDLSYLSRLDTHLQSDIILAKTGLQNKYSHFIPDLVMKTKTVVRSYNPLSWKQTQMVLSGLIGAAYTGSTDEDSLLELRKKFPSTVGKFVDELLEYRSLTKAHSTYVKGALSRQKSGRVHTTFLIHGTTTGRLSSTGPNLQNIPRDKTYRSIYIG